MLTVSPQKKLGALHGALYIFGLFLKKKGSFLKSEYNLLVYFLDTFSIIFWKKTYFQSLNQNVGSL